MDGRTEVSLQNQTALIRSQIEVDTAKLKSANGPFKALLERRISGLEKLLDLYRDPDPGPPMSADEMLAIFEKVLAEDTTTEA
jgi:hypothetical protein